MIKKLTAVFLALSMLFAFAACGENSETDVTTESTTSYIREVKTKIAAPEGPYGFGMLKISTDRNYAYNVRFCQKMSEVVDLIVAGEVEIAALPVELAAEAYTKSNGAIQVLSVNALGMFHIIEKGKNLKTLEDINGKTVYTSGEGTADDFIIRDLLKKNNLTPEIKYTETWEELITLSVEGGADICIVPEPYLTEILARTNPLVSESETTSADSAEKEVGFVRVANLNALWDKTYDASLARSVVVARKDYISANPDLIKEFMGFNEVAVNYLTAAGEGAALYLVENGFYERNDAALNAINCSNTKYLEGEEMKTSVSATLDYLFKADSAFIGGTLPDDGFYYIP